MTTEAHEQGHAKMVEALGHTVVRISTYESGADAGECEWEWKNGKPVLKDWRLILLGGVAALILLGDATPDSFWNDVRFSDDARLYKKLYGTETIFLAELAYVTSIIQKGGK